MTRLEPVRGLASGVTHYGRNVNWSELTIFGHWCWGTLEPLEALCGSMIGRGRGTIRMRSETKINCNHCRRYARLIDDLEKVEDPYG